MELGMSDNVMLSNRVLQTVDHTSSLRSGGCSPLNAKMFDRQVEAKRRGSSSCG